MHSIHFCITEYHYSPISQQTNFSVKLDYSVHLILVESENNNYATYLYGQSYNSDVNK